MASPLDAAALGVVRGSLRETRARESHKRQLSRIGSRKRATESVIGSRAAAGLTSTRERGRQVRSTERAKHKAAIETITVRNSARIAGNQEILEQREAFRAARQSQQQQSDTSRLGVSRSIASPITSGASDNAPLIMTILFTMAGLIVAFKLVTSPGVPSFLKGATDWIHALSSTKALFTTKTKVK